MLFTDIGGHQLALAPAWRPRAGQWALVRLKDEAAHADHVRLGAHVARNGMLVGIFVEQRVTSPVAVDGTPAGGHVEPARVQLVDADGNNLIGLVRVPGQGLKAVDAFYHWGSSAVAAVEPLTDLADFPPGRDRHPDWKPQE